MTQDPYDATENPPLTKPSQPSDGFALTLFLTPNAADYAVGYTVKSEGWYSLKHVSRHGSLYFVRRSAQPINNATADMGNGIPIGEESVGLVFYAAQNDRFSVWRSSLSDNASLSYWGRKKPDFPIGSTINCGPVGIYLSRNDEPPCEHTASDVQFIEGDGIEIAVGCPTEDGGVGTVEITATGGGAEDYLWLQRDSSTGKTYDIHADHFSGMNLVAALAVHDAQSNTAHFVLNDYWLVYALQQPE